MFIRILIAEYNGHHHHFESVSTNIDIGRSYVSVKTETKKNLWGKRFSHKTFTVGFWPVMQARDSIINFLFEFGISLNSLYPVFWMSSGSAESVRFGISGQWLFSQIKLNICLFILRKSRTSEAFQKCECKWNGNFGTNQIKANEIIQSRRLVKFRPILDFHPYSTERYVV